MKTHRALTVLALMGGLLGPGVAHASPVALAGDPSEGGGATTSAAPSHNDEDKCLLGEFCVGPMLTLGAIDPLGVGAHVRYGRYLGFGIDYQFLPTSLDVSNASADWSLLTVEGRWYPFAGAFFLAGGFAYQSFSASMHTMTTAGDVGLSGSVGIPAFKLGLGFMGHDGFVLGADLGFNIPLGGTDVEFDAVTGAGAAFPNEVAKMQADIEDAADGVVSFIPVLPQINLIRVGYLF